MPITIKPKVLKVKATPNSEYTTLDVVSDNTTVNRIQAIEQATVNATNTATTAVNSAKESALSAITTKIGTDSVSRATATEIEDMIAPTFSTSNTYKTGDYVLFTTNNVVKLYRFITDHTAGNWNSAQVSEVKTGSQISDLKSALMVTSYTTTSGKYVHKDTGVFTTDSTGSPSVISDIPVISGDTVSLTFSRISYGGNRGYAFYDKSGHYVSGGGYTVSASETTLSITVPANAATFAFTTFVDNTYSLSGITEIQSIVKRLNDSDVSGEVSRALTMTYTTTSGKYVNRNDGTLVSDSSGSPSAISNIPVIAGDTLMLYVSKVLYVGNRGYAFYDVDGNYISGLGYTANTLTYTITVPDKAAYFAFTTFAEAFYTLTGNTKLQSVINTANNAYYSAKNGYYGNRIALANLAKASGAYVNGTTGATASHSDYDYYEMAVYPGIKVSVTPGFTHQSAGYCVYDNNGSPVSSGYSPYSESDSAKYDITVPSGGYTLKFTAKKTVTPIVNGYATANDNYLAISQADKYDPTDPYCRIDCAPSFITMFRTIACIGDSLTVGGFNTTSPNENGATIKAFSYPENMKKMTGADVKNFGEGGTTAAHPTVSENDRSWWGTMLNDQDVGMAFTETGYDAYIIALGTNDIIKNGSFTGTVDASGVEDKSTSVGGYCEIIQKIKEVQPKAVIFVVTISRYRNTAETRAEANAKIKAIADYYDCYVIDLENHDVGNFDTYYKNGSHNNALGYNLRARQYIAYIDWIIANNLDDFQNVQFIGTNYDYENQ